MILTNDQSDALGELINIAFARTASSLSELSGNPVHLEVPTVTVHPIDALSSLVRDRIQEHVATVHQIFAGTISGDALLVLNYKGALKLTDLLCEATSSSSELDASGREALLEVGNILLNACLGMFGNLLKVRILFSIPPRIHLENFSEILREITVDAEELRYAVLVSTAFSIEENDVSGYLLIVLGVTSLDRLLKGLETWERSQQDSNNAG